MDRGRWEEEVANEVAVAVIVGELQNQIWAGWVLADLGRSVLRPYMFWAHGYGVVGLDECTEMSVCATKGWTSDEEFFVVFDAGLTTGGSGAARA